MYGTERFYRARLFVPVSMQAEIEGTNQLDSRACGCAYVIGRLAPRATRAQAVAALKLVASDLAREFPKENTGLSVDLADPGWLGLGGAVSSFAGGLMGLAILVLLAACANLAGLLLARAADRRREMGIRLAIGAGRGRLIRQIVTEVALLTLIGGGLAAVAAMAGLAALSRWRAPLSLPLQLDLRADWRVLTFSALAVSATTLLCALAPCRAAWRLDLVQVSRGVSLRTVRRRWGIRELLVLGQVAVCCLLVLASFMATRGLTAALAAPLGMRLDRVDVAGADLALAQYSRPHGARAVQDGRAFQRRALEAIRALPGVETAAYSSGLPLNIDQSTNVVFPENALDFTLRNGTQASMYAVSPGYFATMGTRLLRGRDFTPADDQRSAPVAIVNERFARIVLGREDAVGARFRYGQGGNAITVVGIVEDGKYKSLTENPQPAVFQAAAQNYYSNTDFLVRRAEGAASVARDMRQVIARMNPDVPVYTNGAAAEVLDFAFLPTRAATIAIGVFGVLAALLAVTGIHAIAAYAVSSRTREISIRIAIGGRGSQIVRAVLGRVVLLVVAGSVLGLGGGIAAIPRLGGVVYGSAAVTPAVLSLAVSAVVVLAIGAAWTPTRRVLTADPARTLRAD